MRLLDLDVDSRTVDVAVNDKLGLITQKLGTISISETRRNFGMKAIKKIVREYDITGFVLSLPKNMDDSGGTSVDRSKDYSKKLEEKFSLPVAYSDEHLTTIEANCVLIEEAEIHDRKKKKKSSIK